MGVTVDRPATTALLSPVTAVITAPDLYLVYRVIR
jgi:hypothetical protein